MRKRTRKQAAEQTPKQRKAQARRVRYHARSLAFCNSLQFWQECQIGACRRNHSCRGEPHACFTRHWRSVPEDEFAMARAEIHARQERMR